MLSRTQKTEHGNSRCRLASRAAFFFLADRCRERVRRFFIIGVNRNNRHFPYAVLCLWPPGVMAASCAIGYFLGQPLKVLSMQIDASILLFSSCADWSEGTHHNKGNRTKVPRKGLFGILLNTNANKKRFGNNKKKRTLKRSMGSSGGSKATASPPGTSIADVLVRDLWREPLHAKSRTSERLGHIDFAMVVPPLRSFFYCTICPFLCYPIAALSAYGFLRCCRTITWPEYSRKEKYAGHVMYAVQKRVYDDRRKRLAESQVNDVLEMQHAIDVSQGVRHQFVDDPDQRGTAYLVVEQRVMKAEAIFTGENWAWAFISDSCRYLTPIAWGFLFHPSCRRLLVDLKLWRQGRLYYKQIRHPLLNFFKTYAEFNQSMQRVNVTKAPTGVKSWSRNL
eukprot:gene6624-4744_t